MITAAEALEAAAERIPDRERIDETQLSEEDARRLDYIDATVDSLLYKHFVGDAVAIPVPVEMNGQVLATAPAIAALKQRYEDGGWSVGVFPQPENGNYNLIFSAPRSRTPSPEAAKPLPRIVDSTAQEVASATRKVLSDAVEQGLRGTRVVPRILVRMPTRGRAAQALEVMALYKSMAGCPIKMEIVVDEDDKDTLRAEVLQRFAAMGCTVTVGKHTSKVEACNGGRVTGWDVLVLASDDMWPAVDGWGLRVLEEMEKHWPTLDGALHFNDGFQRSRLCTLPIMGRRLWEQFDRVVYNPAYKSLYCDREYTEMFRALGRLTYVDEKIIEHRHHLWNRAEVDETYARNDALENDDKLVYEFRKQNVAAMPHLSLLICSVPRRRLQLERLVSDLHAQIVDGHGSRLPVEICVDLREDISVGEKRQALLERSRGRFVCSIDDDDGVAHDYVQRIFQAIQSNPSCVALVGIITIDGRNPQRFEHSLKFDGWYTDSDGLFCRTPNHLNPIRRDIALQVGFVSKNHGEDYEFSMGVRPLLLNETSAGDTPLYWYWYKSK